MVLVIIRVEGMKVLVTGSSLWTVWLHSCAYWVALQVRHVELSSACLRNDITLSQESQKMDWAFIRTRGTRAAKKTWVEE